MRETKQDIAYDFYHLVVVYLSSTRSGSKSHLDRVENAPFLPGAFFFFFFSVASPKPKHEIKRRHRHHNSDPLPRPGRGDIWHLQVKAGRVGIQFVVKQVHDRFQQQ